MKTKVIENIIKRENATLLAVLSIEESCLIVLLPEGLRDRTGALDVFGQLTGLDRRERIRFFLCAVS